MKRSAKNCLKHWLQFSALVTAVFFNKIIHSLLKTLMMKTQNTKKNYQLLKVCFIYFSTPGLGGELGHAKPVVGGEKGRLLEVIGHRTDQPLKHLAIAFLSEKSMCKPRNNQISKNQTVKTLKRPKLISL